MISIHRIILVIAYVPIFALMEISALATPDLSRAEVTKQVRKQEELRGNYRIRVESSYAKGKRKPKSQRDYSELLQSANGEYHIRNYYSPQGSLKKPIFSDSTWNNIELRAEQFPAGTPNDPHIFVLDDNNPENNELDFIEITLGRRIIYAAIKPSELLTDPEVDAKIEQSVFNGVNCVKITITDPPIFPYADIILYYDPARQWLLTGFENHGKRVDKRTNEKYVKLASYCTVTEYKQVDGIWMPWKLVGDNITYDDVKRNKITERVTTILPFLSIEMNPPVTDADFTIPVDSLPTGSSVVDNRLGISYKLGDDVLYMDGHLHQLTAPITGEIKPQDLANIMKGSTPLIDPDEKKLQPIQNKSPWYTKSTGLGLIALGFFAAGIAVWKRSRA